MKVENKYVFAVCGDDVHIDTLNKSMKYLKHFSKNEIIVVTDKTRNKKEIEHNNIINFQTPEKLTHHQASIYLKTSLHRYLDINHNYCYLDSDVLAINKNADSIFNYFIAPITFAPDHCKINSFSPHAVNCGCLEKRNNEISELEKLIEKFNPYYFSGSIQNNHKSREFYRLASHIKSNPFKNISYILQFIIGRYISSNKKIKLTDTIIFDKETKTWQDQNKEIFLYHALNYYRSIEKESDFRFNLFQLKWKNKNKEDLYNLTCNHLLDKIRNTFKIEITNNKWQHWNGGVFLFNKKSKEFLDVWHNYTLEIFNNSEWKTRDQGTLAATAWKFGLDKHPVLPKTFNFIADYNNPEITYTKEKGFTADNFKTIIQPYFIHIYHKYGEKGWEIWDAVENILLDKNE